LVVTIHVAPGSRIPVRALAAVEAEAGKGLVGDRYHGIRHRHVTIQSQQMLDLAADELGYRFDPGATRRNLTVDAGDIPTTPGARLTVGEAELEVVRVSAPCRLLTSGTIHVGHAVELSEVAI
jgi:MOSC domain-containing protein YiiM